MEHLRFAVHTNSVDSANFIVVVGVHQGAAYPRVRHLRDRQAALCSVLDYGVEIVVLQVLYRAVWVCHEVCPPFSTKRLMLL